MPSGDQLIIVLYSYLPAILLGAFFWWMDRFEREPVLLIVVAFLWGAFGAGLLSAFWNTFFLIALEIYESGNQANEILTAVVIAPFIEEMTKGGFILAALWLKQVDNVTDGILLGIVIGLGFAAAENVDYAYQVFESSGELAMWNNLWFREIHTTLLHASATAVWGAFAGYSRLLRGKQKAFTLANGFILAMVTHGFWNFLASYVGSFQSRFNLIEWVMKGELVVIFGFLMALFLYSVMEESRTIIAELQEESANGVIPPEHVEFFASLVRHPKKYALPKRMRSGDYARLGVKLAFCKRAYRFNPDPKNLDEIQKLRTALKSASEYQGHSLSLRYG